MNNLFEILLLTTCGLTAGIRAYNVDRLIRLINKKESIDFLGFINTTELIQLFAMFFIVRPFTKQYPNAEIERTRKMVNRLTYITYAFLLGIIIKDAFF